MTENGTVENIERLFQAAEDADAKVFVSPHYYYPHDHNWEFEGALEALMHDIGMFDRKGPLDASSVESSGADWLERYKPYINDGETVVVSPHKVYGPNSNDLALQLRKAGISQIVLAGMSANLCVESHMRNLIEEGFEVAIVSDATAAAKLPGYDGFEAAFVNYRMIASDVWSTDEAVEKIAAARGNLVNISGASGIGLDGFDPVSFFESESPRNGSPMIRAEHAGATYLFASEQNRERFLADPDPLRPPVRRLLLLRRVDQHPVARRHHHSPDPQRQALSQRQRGHPQEVQRRLRRQRVPGERQLAGTLRWARPVSRSRRTR